VRVYHLRFDGQWVDWGVGYLWLGAEIPLADPAAGAKHQHVIVKAEKKNEQTKATAVEGAEGASAADSTAAAAAAAAPAASAPVTPLGLPSLLLPTLLSLHVPDISHLSMQGETIITMTTLGSAAAPAHRRAHQHQQEQLAAAGQQAATADPDARSPLVAVAEAPALLPADNDEIDVALSFQSAADAQQLWTYFHSFPSVQQQQIEEAAAEDAALQEEEQQEEAEAGEQQATDAPLPEEETNADDESSDLFPRIAQVVSRSAAHSPAPARVRIRACA
jgi:hypothetical protein